MVVPRAQMHQFFTRAQELAQKAGAGVVGCGHAGDGNVHLAVFCGDDDVRHRLLHDIFAAGMELGGRSPASTAWAGSRCDTSWSWRIRSRLR